MSDAGALPTHAPAGIGFADADPDLGSIQGRITVHKAADESDVTSYAVYYGVSATQKLYFTPIFVAPATGSDVSYPLDVAPPPSGATSLIAFARNAVGEMTTGVATAFHDNVPAAVDISAGQGSGSGAFPAIAIDAANDKVLVVTNDGSNSGKPTLLRCSIDGTSCTQADISAGQGLNRGQLPSIAVDAANGKLLVVTEDASNSDKPSLFRCNLDGTSCTWIDISAGQGSTSGYNSTIAIDAANGKLLVVTDDGNNSEKPSLFRCNLDGTSCTWTDISAGQGSFSGHTPAIAIDAANGKLVVAAQNGSASGKPGLFRCNLDGTSCTWTDISTGRGTNSGFNPAIAIDATNGKILVVTEDFSNSGKPSLFRCNLDGTSCTWTDISAGQGTDSGAYPAIAIDTANSKLLVVTENDASSSTPSLFRSNLDGTDCAWTDLSAGQGASSGLLPAIAGSADGHFFVAAQNTANADKPELYLLK